jgi:hypothetical protein
MKCVTKDVRVKRVSNEAADRLVSERGWIYAPKLLWKKMNDNHGHKPRKNSVEIVE